MASRRSSAPSDPRSARRARCGTRDAAGRACSPGTGRPPPGARRRPRRARPCPDRPGGRPRSAPAPRGWSTSSDSSATSCGPRRNPPCRQLYGAPVGDTVLYEAGDGVATLTLNRPRRLNAIVPELMEDFDAGLARAEADEAVRVVRLRGAGRAFCAGYDIGWGAAAMQDAEGDEPWDPMADLRMMSRYVGSYMSLWRSPKPVVAQVQGFCVGGGTDFALCSDLIVVAQDASIGYPPARGWGSPTTAMWIYRVGLERAKRLLLTGDALDGARAVAWGLASECVPAAELDGAALALCRRIARLPANQLQMMKLLVN